MRWLRDFSIRYKLLAFSLLTSGTILVLALITFVSRDIGFQRDSLESELLAIGEIVGRNSIASIVFDDPEDAGGTIESLSIKPYIQNATLYRPDGTKFASRAFGTKLNRIVDRSCIEKPRTDIVLGAAYVDFTDGTPSHANLCKALVIDADESEHLTCELA